MAINLKGLLGSNVSGTSLLSDPIFMSGLGLLQSGSQPGATIGSSLLPAITSGVTTAQTFGKIEKQNKFNQKLTSGEEITENDLADAYPETYAEFKIKDQFSKQDPFSKVGKINADFVRGAITSEQYENLIKKETGLKEFAPGNAEKFVEFSKKIYTNKSDKELLDQWISLQTTEKESSKTDFMAKAYSTTLNSMIGNSPEDASKAAQEAGEFYDKFLSSASTNNTDTYIEGQIYTNPSTGERLIYKDGQFLPLDN
jgi:hypothetical protein